ncbi:MAG TPA: AAA family ATPase [Gemmatimonadaceae bacterium]|nr:AAA family ATPase [Gemmatimonadaceae bacterium]
MPGPDIVRDLELLVRSRYALIFLDADEDARADEVMEYLATSLALPLFNWSATKGLRRAGVDAAAYDTAAPAKALAFIEASHLPALYHLHGFGDALGDAGVVAKLKDAAANFQRGAGAIVISGQGIAIPAALSALATRIALPAPAPADYKRVLDHVVRDTSARMRVSVTLTSDEQMQLIGNLRGVTLLEAERILTKAIIEDGKLDATDIPKVIAAKRDAVAKDGVLQYVSADAGMGDVVGLDGLKGWLAKRRLILTEPQRASQFGLSFPKGLLLLGVPGCGKSLCAKAVAKEWALPLLKLDTGSLYDKFVGETEKNFRRALDTAEKVAPDVLWIDEIEKAFAAGGSDADGGLSTRLLGGFLTWLQDRNGDVFVVATANDIERLPPELLRKGRFDEIFFVDLPGEAARAAIFALHLQKRGQAPAAFDLDALARAADGFSGSEIEQVVVSALYSAFAAKQTLTTAGVLAEVKATRPLSQTMADKLAALREWARDKTVGAE